MAYTILANRKNASAVIHFTSNSELIVAGNNAVSNIAAPGEVLSGVTITQATFGSPSGAGAYWKVSRGANTVAVFDSTAQIDLAGTGAPINVSPDATLKVELVGSTDGFLILEVQKLNLKYDYLS